MSGRRRARGVPPAPPIPVPAHRPAWPRAAGPRIAGTGSMRDTAPPTPPWRLLRFSSRRYRRSSLHTRSSPAPGPAGRCTPGSAPGEEEHLVARASHSWSHGVMSAIVWPSSELRSKAHQLALGPGSSPDVASSRKISPAASAAPAPIDTLLRWAAASNRPGGSLSLVQHRASPSPMHPPLVTFGFQRVSGRRSSGGVVQRPLARAQKLPVEDVVLGDVSSVVRKPRSGSYSEFSFRARRRPWPAAARSALRAASTCPNRSRPQSPRTPGAR